MFTPVHRTYVFITVLCALLFTSILPHVVRAQEESLDVEVQSIQEKIDFLDSSEVVSFLNLYPTEGVPGGGDILGDFVVGPGKVDLTLSPGETKIVEMTVTNRTGERRRFNITTEDAEGSLDTNTSIVLLGDDRGPYSMKDYVSVSHKVFDLEHNQRARIPVTISLPLDAEPGGLYGSVLVNTIAIEAKQGDSGGAVPQSAIIARIGTLFFITIPGAAEKEGGLKDFTTITKKIFYQSSPITFGILYENNGVIHLAPYGELRIKNMFDEEVGYVQLDPWFVLPQSLRLREVSWDRDFLFGRYTATASINRSYDDVVDELSYSFWILPWKPLALTFIVLFIVFFSIKTFFKRFEFKRKT
ncbi:MAG: DUF916 domain-containing protein [Candidatus Pacebacteria bacterium]|nr:DUF916 domain-containing protein [Candidatus Paceibacterota bacterium]MCF7856973.1 DUF916 domain-containing protein [Candidatus Paceibacterota bacterium]